MRHIRRGLVFAAVAGILFSAAGNAGQNAPKELLFSAYGEVMDSITYSHVLMSASQARLQRLKWSFGSWGLSKQKRTIDQEYNRIGSSILRFREQADRLESGDMDPLAGEKALLAKEPRVERAGQDIPDSVYGQVEEILRIREKDYDSDASRSRLIRAEYAVRKLGDRLGPLQLLPEQSQALSLVQGIRDELVRYRAAAQASLPSDKKASAEKDVKWRGAVLRDLGGLETDATDLSTELDRMRLMFMLSNLMTGKSGKGVGGPR